MSIQGNVTTIPGQIARAVCLILAVLPPLTSTAILIILTSTGQYTDFLFTASAMKINAAIAAGIAAVPVLFLCIEGGMRRVDSGMLRAASTLGMHRGMIIRKIIIPQSRFYILTGAAAGAARFGGEYMCSTMLMQSMRGHAGNAVKILTAAVDVPLLIRAAIVTTQWLLAGGAVILVIYAASFIKRR